MKKFISFSGGVESSTMCVLFGNKADAIFADTGFEHKEIYDRIELVEKWVQNFHRSDFKIHMVQQSGADGHEEIKTLPDYIKYRKYYPSFQRRFCTKYFKIDPIDEFLEQFKDEGCELYIGLNAEEQNRITYGGHGNKPFVNYSYPLAENGITRAMCIEILKKVNLYPNFPPYMKRGGCIGCYYKSIKEFEALALLNPVEFKVVEDLENEINGTMRDGNSRNKVMFTIKEKKSMKQIRQHALSILFKPEEIYATVNDATQCGVFCNR
jgi:hypothetical protein